MNFGQKIFFPNLGLLNLGCGLDAGVYGKQRNNKQNKTKPKIQKQGNENFETCGPKKRLFTCIAVRRCNLFPISLDTVLVKPCQYLAFY